MKREGEPLASRSMLDARGSAESRPPGAFLVIWIAIYWAAAFSS
jgi:hypothetical protein